MKRRKVSREFKLGAVKLVLERGVSVAQASRDLELSESVLRRRMREADAAPTPDPSRRLHSSRSGAHSHPGWPPSTPSDPPTSLARNDGESGWRRSFNPPSGPSRTRSSSREIVRKASCERLSSIGFRPNDDVGRAATGRGSNSAGD